ncbi:ketohydroxyglutarate aldolase [Arthrobacter sp. 260]|uniref:ketohydroxyglutarate aldolase n=1 Tax=Arthrobacter sp. 260 TaxID=2735314 RepID=UPI0014930F6F|nr:ketohydroxyglutarate aldolase [Arthrobacter sp. 260]NOJ59486.1 ketohydroxyglutarate aldolase [Arthrobacter sp. 260]
MNFTVTVQDSHRSEIQDVAERLRARGLEVDRVLEAVGMITGSAPEDRQAELEAVDGVSSVDGEVRFLLPPPDSDIQ